MWRAIIGLFWSIACRKTNHLNSGRASKQSIIFRVNHPRSYKGSKSSERKSVARCSEVSKTLRARKAIRNTPTRLFCKAGLFMCFKGNKNWNKRKSFVPRDAFVLKIRRELCHPKCARKVSGLSRHGPQCMNFMYIVHQTTYRRIQVFSTEKRTSSFSMAIMRQQ